MANVAPGKFCGQCGGDLQKKKEEAAAASGFCTGCGSPLGADSKFCGQCGAQRD